MVPIWVSEPMGFEIPRRIASTPAMNVVATAPIPGSKIPSLPVAGRMSVFPDCDSGMVAPSKAYRTVTRALVQPVYRRLRRCKCRFFQWQGGENVVENRPSSTPHARRGDRACPNARVAITDDAGGGNNAK